MVDLMAERDRKQAVQAAFARAAETYDAHVDVQRDVAAGLLARLDAGRWAPQRILEIGCGTGNLTRGLAEAFPQAAITAIDFCPEMLSVAQRKLAAYDRVRFECADGEQYGLEERRGAGSDAGQAPSGSFDLIASSAAFQWFDRLSEAARRFAEMLSNDGTLAFAMFGPATFGELSRALARSWPEAIPAAAAFLDAAGLQAMFLEAFGHVEIVEHRERREYPSLVDLLKKIQLTGTGAGERPGMLTPARLRRLESEYRRAEGSIVATYQVFFCQARHRTT